MTSSAGLASYTPPEVKRVMAAMTVFGCLKGGQYIKDMGVKEMRALTVLAVVGAVVPFGFVAIGAFAGVYYPSRYLTRQAMHAFRELKGYAQPGDFDVLDQYNRLADQAYRVSVPMPVQMPPYMTKPIQKTVFRSAEIR